MAVRIRLLRMGKIRHPQYRIVVADSRTKRDGRAIEEIGIYHPKEEPSRIEVNSERVQHWLSVGAQPSEPVKAILSKTGDWQKFKGLPPPTEPLRVAAAAGRPHRGLRGRGAGRGRRQRDQAGQEGRARQEGRAQEGRPRRPSQGRRRGRRKADAKQAEPSRGQGRKPRPSRQGRAARRRRPRRTKAAAATEEPAGAGADQAG